MKTKVFALAVLASLALVQAFAAPSKVLSQATLDKFAKTAPALLQDLEKIESIKDGTFAGAFDMNDGDFTMKRMKDAFASLKKVREINEVLKKHGWNESFWDVYVVIVAAYFVTTMDTMIAQMGDSANAYVDAKSVKEMRDSVHADDVALIKKNMGKLEAAMSSVAGE